MGVKKNQIVAGIIGFVQDEILPKMSRDRALQIGLSVAVNAAKANDRLIDTVFGNEVVKAVLEENSAGEYEIGELLDSLKQSIEKYGELPLAIPPIPLFAPQGATITLDADDIAAIKRRIEAGGEAQ